MNGTVTHCVLLYNDVAVIVPVVHHHLSSIIGHTAAVTLVNLVMKRTCTL